MMKNSGAATVTISTGSHGEVRGLSLSRRSSQFEGRFGRMFRSLPAAHFSEEMLKELAEKMTAKEESEPTPETERDEEENDDIPAGYTYLGQFIDHDLTFDPVSSLQRQNDPDGLVNYRTPRFDLDCVYGRGPDDQPYLYRKDGIKMLLGDPLTGNADDPGARDLPRIRPHDGEPERAIIGDPRNDENVIVSQLQSAMIRFHNLMADIVIAEHENMKKLDPANAKALQRSRAEIFEEIQRQVRWHYQWIVYEDFLPTIVGESIFREIKGQIEEGETPTAKPPQLKHYKIAENAFIPVEFSIAAYRFGHSMVRPLYRLSETIPGDGRERLPIFSMKPDILVRFGRFPSNWAIDWRLFFPIEDRPKLDPRRVQPSYHIDTSVANPLSKLEVPPGTDVPPSLIERNLLRGWRMQLPSGQAVARAMGIKPLEDSKLLVGSDGDPDKTLTRISPSFANNAPLWYYILAEAQHYQRAEKMNHLGPVGGRIVGEVIVGLLLADSHSFLRQDPFFKPKEDLMRDGKFKMADLLYAVKSR
jgi:Animal haem peroxidase